MWFGDAGLFWLCMLRFRVIGSALHMQMLDNLTFLSAKFKDKRSYKYQRDAAFMLFIW